MNYGFNKIKIFKIATSLLSILLTLYTVELFLSFYYIFPIPIANYYPFAPAVKGGSIAVDQYEFTTDHYYNSQGFRDHEINFKKSPNKQRILFIGDSFVEGYGVQVEQRFSDLLINKLGGNYESINIGQLATNPDNYFDNLINFGVALNPDIVVMGVFIGNDFMGGRSYKIPSTYKINNEIKKNVNNSRIKNIVFLRHIRELFNQVVSPVGVPKIQKRFISGNFWDLYFNKKMTKNFFIEATNVKQGQLDKLVKTFNQDLLPYYYTGKIIPTLLIEGINNKKISKAKIDVKSSENILLEPYYIESDYVNTLWFLKESNKILKNNKIKFVIVIIPDINQVYPEKFKSMLKNDFDMDNIPLRLKQLEDYRARLTKDLNNENITYIDITKPLKKFNGMTYYLYDQHMNVDGHKVTSEELYKLIKNK